MKSIMNYYLKINSNNYDYDYGNDHVENYAECLFD
jgi:hypothetical protein